MIVLRHFSLFSVAIIDILGLTENFLYSGNDTYNQPVYLIIQYYSTELNDLCYSMHNDKPNSTSAAVHECQDRIVNVIEYSKSSIKCIHIMICSRISIFLIQFPFVEWLSRYVSSGECMERTKNILNK